MKNTYRINTRFDLDDPVEKEAVEYLAALNQNGHQLRNKFIVEAVCEAVKRKTNNYCFSREDVREMLRDELGRAFMVFSGGNIQPLPFTPDSPDMCQEDIDDAVLEDLSIFGC